MTTGHGVPRPPSLPHRTVWALALGCGITVANLYYSQPLLPAMAQDLGVPENRLGIVSALTQSGYAVGLLLLVPLGDALERRRLLLTMLGLVSGMLIAVALSPGIVWLAVASLLLGAATVVPQMLVPFAAGLAGPGERGWVVGRVMSGLLVGLLAARTVSGFVNARFGWRVVYGMAAGLTVLLAGVYVRILPTSYPARQLSYGQLLRSFGRLLAAEPLVRQSCLFGAAAFGAFSVFWTTLAFHLARPPFEFGSAAVGLFGLAGIAGALAAPIAGKVADRRGSTLLIGTGLMLALLSFGLFFAFGQQLAGLVTGVLLLDFGVQSAHISNQARIYRLPPEMHNRLNSVYMVAFFLGGAAGSCLGTYGWSGWGWPGVCAAGASFALVGLAGYGWTTLRAGGVTGPGRIDKLDCEVQPAAHPPVETTMLTREQFVGVWKLVSWENHLADGTVRYPFGKDAAGYLFYWENGYMATEIMTAGRPPQRSSEDLFEGTTEEKAAMMRTFLAYCGRFEVRGDTVIHHIEVGSFPNWVGKGHVRSARFDGHDCLVLSLPMPIGGVAQTAYFTWRRV